MIDDNAQIRLQIINAMNFAIAYNTLAYLTPAQAMIIIQLFIDNAPCPDIDAATIEAITKLMDPSETDVEIDIPTKDGDCFDCSGAHVQCNRLWNKAIECAKKKPERPACCLSCKYWEDPGYPVPLSNCRRLVLGPEDLVTRVEDAKMFGEDFFFNTPADFCCKYYEPKDQTHKQSRFPVDLARTTLPNYPPLDLTGSSN